MDDAEQREILAARSGDADAFARLIRCHEAAVARQMWRLTRDRTAHEELVQDVLVEAYYSLETFSGKSPLTHWLSRIATRVGYRFWKQQRRTEAVQTIDKAELIAAEEQNDATAAAELLHRLFARLKPPERIVLTLLHLEACSTEQIAQRTGWPRAIVKMRAMRVSSPW